MGRAETLAIDSKGLGINFEDTFAVRGLDLEIPSGTIFGFIGPSGSGKTTAIRLLTGIYTPTEGNVRVLGQPPSKFSQKVRQMLGYMPQIFALYGDLTVIENLNFSASLYGKGPFRGKRINSMLDFVELGEDRYKLARKLSGGMQRRLSLAATLIHDPELIFLDEPTAGIDPVLRRKFWEYFRQLRDEGRTLFITTQYVSEAEHCDLIGVMHHGKLLMVKTPEGLRHAAFGGDIIDLQFEDIPPQTLSLLKELPLVLKPPTITGKDRMRVVVEDASTAIPALMDWFNQNGIDVASIEQYYPPFDDVFFELVKEKDV